MKKVSITLDFGKIDMCGSGCRVNRVTVNLTLKYKNGRNYINLEPGNFAIFSASVDVWNSRETDIICGGQCLDSIPTEQIRDKKMRLLFHIIRNLWEKWHLNDLMPGAKLQMDFLKTQGLENADFSEQVEALKKEGIFKLQYHTIFDVVEYTYGYEWLIHPIDEDDLQTIKNIFLEYGNLTDAEKKFLLDK